MNKPIHTLMLDTLDRKYPDAKVKDIYKYEEHEIFAALACN